MLDTQIQPCRHLAFGSRRFKRALAVLASVLAMLTFVLANIHTPVRGHSFRDIGPVLCQANGHPSNSTDSPKPTLDNDLQLTAAKDASSSEQFLSGWTRCFPTHDDSGQPGVRFRVERPPRLVRA
jgi:hypothetical protein